MHKANEYFESTDFPFEVGYCSNCETIRLFVILDEPATEIEINETKYLFFVGICQKCGSHKSFKVKENEKFPDICKRNEII